VDEETQMVVNATSIGTADEEARVPLDIASLRPQMIVADVTVDPAETRLLRDAARCGCKTLPGSRILVNQLALSFATWTGDDPDKTIMSEALEEYLEL
jgi:shikimate dehydrogenase